MAVAKRQQTKAKEYRTKKRRGSVGSLSLAVFGRPATEEALMSTKREGRGGQEASSKDLLAPTRLAEDGRQDSILPGVIGNAAESLKLPLRKVIQIGQERRNMLLTAKWTIHSAPCLINAPPGGFESNVSLVCVSDCRFAEHPHARHGERRHDTAGAPHADETTPMPRLSSPRAHRN